MKRRKRDIIGYLVIGAGFQIEKGLELSPSPRNGLKYFRKILSLFTSINCHVWWVNELWLKEIDSKLHPVACTNTHHDVKDLVNHKMVKNTKTWISRERNITFLWNKKIINLCHRLHILRSYHFAAEVTFKQNMSLPIFVFHKFHLFHSWILCPGSVTRTMSNIYLKAFCKNKGFIVIKKSIIVDVWQLLKYAFNFFKTDKSVENDVLRLKKIETISKVSVKRINRINLGK